MKAQKKKFIKCVLREDVDLLVSLLGLNSNWKLINDLGEKRAKKTVKNEINTDQK
jgi:hypothetical protein